jgi:glycerol-3-phosphate acyltransferase PlsX
VKEVERQLPDKIAAIFEKTHSKDTAVE